MNLFVAAAVVVAMFIGILEVWSRLQTHQVAIVGAAICIVAVIAYLTRNERTGGYTGADVGTADDKGSPDTPDAELQCFVGAPSDMPIASWPRGHDFHSLRKNTARYSKSDQKRAGAVARRKKEQSAQMFWQTVDPPRKGLVIQSVPLRKLLSGTKTLELRSRPTRQLGPIALIEKGSGTVVGVANIVSNVGPMEYAEFERRATEHGVEPERLRAVFEKGYVYGWALANVLELRTPVPYVHRGMSQVILDPAAVEALAHQLRG